jgi:hypothetical protein
MQTDDTNRLAEKIAKLIAAESGGGELATLFAGIEKINHRLDKLESASSNPQSAIRDPQSDGPRSANGDLQSQHPSLDKLTIAEAIADSIFGSQFKEKACQFETDKPCDHCSMCNSRGF